MTWAIWTYADVSAYGPGAARDAFFITAIAVDVLADFNRYLCHCTMGA